MTVGKRLFSQVMLESTATAVGGVSKIGTFLQSLQKDKKRVKVVVDEASAAYLNPNRADRHDGAFQTSVYVSVMLETARYGRRQSSEVHPRETTRFAVHLLPAISVLVV